MAIAISANKVGWLLIAWAFFLGLVGTAVGIPLILMVIGTILYLFA